MTAPSCCKLHAMRIPADAVGKSWLYIGTTKVMRITEELTKFDPPLPRHKIKHHCVDVRTDAGRLVDAVFCIENCAEWLVTNNLEIY